MTAILQNPIFQDETLAREWLEARVWANGRVCPKCGVVGQSTGLKGKAHRPGVYQCNACREQFTVTVNTVFERSKIPLSKWLAALFLMVSSKKGVSAHQVHRMLGVSYKSTWFMMHRLREAMRSGDLAPVGGGGGTVEVDETYIAQASFSRGKDKVRGPYHKRAILSLVERGGAVRSFHVEGARVSKIAPIVRENLAREAKLMTDESKIYTKIGDGFAAHMTVNHADEEYARYTNVRQFPSGEEFVIHTNTIEGYFSIFKRGMKGVYQHCSEKHLHRYLAEFDFRYSNRSARGIEDRQRAELMALGIVGKRLTYRRTNLGA